MKSLDQKLDSLLRESFQFNKAILASLLYHIQQSI